jgi:hypothetical protein
MQKYDKWHKSVIFFKYFYVFKLNTSKKMTKLNRFWFSKVAVTLFLLAFNLFGIAQNQDPDLDSRNKFWKNVQFGGGFGLNIGSGFTDVTLAPSAIYNVNQYFATGVGLQGTYVSTTNVFQSTIYGVSLIQLFNPVDMIQVSAELEQVRVNMVYSGSTSNNIKENFWNTALFVGLGYRQQNLTIGVRYNVLFNKQDRVYSEALMPFVRIFF